MNRLCNFQLSYFLLEVGNSRCIRVVLSEIRAIVGLEGEVVESIYFILAKLKINGHTLLLELNNGTLHFNLRLESEPEQKQTQWSLELEKKFHTKVCNHGEGLLLVESGYYRFHI